jgi:hypothetical protein
LGSALPFPTISSRRVTVQLCATPLRRLSSGAAAAGQGAGFAAGVLLKQVAGAAAVVTSKFPLAHRTVVFVAGMPLRGLMAPREPVEEEQKYRGRAPSLPVQMQHGYLPLNLPSAPPAAANRHEIGTA